MRSIREHLKKISNNSEQTLRFHTGSSIFALPNNFLKSPLKFSTFMRIYSIQYETRILIHVFFLLSSLKF